MAKGFDMGVVVLLDYVESLATFFTHPSHEEYVHGIHFLPLLTSTHPGKNHFLGRWEVERAVEEK
jgi:hypothetical protein